VGEIRDTPGVDHCLLVADDNERPGAMLLDRDPVTRHYPEHPPGDVVRDAGGNLLAGREADLAGEARPELGDHPA
jgi:hypothetical protein